MRSIHPHNRPTIVVIMPRPHCPPPPKPRPPKEINCACKCSLIVSCAGDIPQGCRERRKEGACPCKPRYLPTCILERPHGCALWQEGKTCDCPRLYMPRCLVTGCDQRRKGKRCDCPRTPIGKCPHLEELEAEYAKLSPQEANRQADVWAEKLWTQSSERYTDFPLASAGVATRTQEEAVALMIVRRNLLGVSLWHPNDRRENENAMLHCRRKEFRKLLLRQQATGMRKLIGAKGGAA